MRHTARVTGRRLAWTALALALLAVPSAARAGERPLVNVSTTGSVNPWFPPCVCELRALGDATTNPQATVDWAAESKPPDEGKPEKLKVGDTRKFVAVGTFDAGIEVPDDWYLDTTIYDEENYTWEAQNAEDVTAEYFPGVAELPKNVRWYRFTKEGDTSVKVRYDRTVSYKYNCPMRKRTEPLGECGGLPEGMGGSEGGGMGGMAVSGPCPLAGAMRIEQRTVNANADSGEISFPVRAYTLELKVRRKEGGDFSQNAKIAAGGLSSDVHVAEVQAKLKPQADEGDSFPFAIELSSPAPEYPADPVYQHGDYKWLMWNNLEGVYVGSVTATADGVLCRHEEPGEEEGEVVTVEHYHTIVSSKKIGASELKSTEKHVNASVSMDFEWAKGPVWQFTDTFEPDVYESVRLTDIKVEGIPLTGHEIWVYPVVVDLVYLEFDWSNFTFHWKDEQKPRTQTNDLSLYTRFADNEDGTGDGRVPVDDEGVATVYQIVPSVVVDGIAGSTLTRVRFGGVVETVLFKAADMDVIKPDAAPSE